MIQTFFDCHSHTEYSNIRLLDCINHPKNLIDRAIELGLRGISITDHEALCSHMIVNKYAKEIKEKYPDFTIALGNEIYLVDTRKTGQPYYHFILLAKDAIGYRALKELSSIAWYNAYVDRRMWRVPLLKSELENILKDYKGHIIGTTACMGGELSTALYGYRLALSSQNMPMAEQNYNQACDFVEWCIKIFGQDDFYIECAPSAKADQVVVNQTLFKLAQYYELKLVVGTDAHYLKKEDRFVHKAYLNSKGGEREVDEFYEYAYLQSPEEVRANLNVAFNDDAIIDWIFDNSFDIQNKIEFYSLEHHQSIPEVPVKEYPRYMDMKKYGIDDDMFGDKYPILLDLFCSKNPQERYWVNQCFEALIDKGIGIDGRYIERLEEEARVKRVIGEKLETCMFAYPNTLQHYIDLFWRCGSTVGAGRGSACSGLNHYLLGITQLDPIQWDLPFWRYLNDERIELGDIDLDLAPSKLPKIFNEIRKERGELGLLQVCTFGTEGTKSAILTACRGYRSEEYPEGIEIGEAQYLSSLVPVERGFQWPIHDLINGNPDKGRNPQETFINAVNKYDGLLDIIIGIEGIVCRRGIHASGVIFFDDNIYDSAAVMRAPNKNLTTQWDLHDQESAGSVKYDFLLTSVQDIIIKTIDLLKRDNVIETDLPLRDIYNKYLHPNVLPLEDNRIWDALTNSKVIGCFQFEGDVGRQAARKIRPHNILEMTDANGLMRLMTGGPGEEQPLDKYVRFKNNISLWYTEMRNAGLSYEEQKDLEPYFLSSYGVPPSQEQLMRMLMDEKLCGFSLGEANAARKIVGKKQMSKIPELRTKVLERAKSPALGRYIWQCGVGPQMGYSFSIIHALAYSFVGVQTLYLATHFNPIYWNTAYLIVNSGSLETETDVDDEERNESSDYRKMAKAIGAIREAGIQVSLADINKSDYGFVPDVENNEILFGLKGMLNVGDEVVEQIIENRPYASPLDFINKVHPKKNAMISLIKGGAFDHMIDRKVCMGWYLWNTCDRKSQLNLQNMNTLINYNLLPTDTEEQVYARKVYEFNKYIKSVCKAPNGYYLNDIAIAFLERNGYIDNVSYDNNTGKVFMANKTWDKIYQAQMNVFRTWLKENQEELLVKLNKLIFKEEWDKYAKNGSLSAWEMEVLCFYYHEHELAHVDMERYGLKKFADLPIEPVVERTFSKGGRLINMFQISHICGTCIAKNKIKSSVTLLTTDGVVEVKFAKNYFALFDKRISARGEDGKNHIVEHSWFNRGSMIIVTGIRSGDTFIAKKYASTPGHTLYHIDEVNGDEIIIRATRAQGDMEDDE